MLIFGIGGNIDDIGGVENSVKSMIALYNETSPITLVCHAHVNDKARQYQPPPGTQVTVIEYTARSWKKNPLIKVYRQLHKDNQGALVIARHHKHVIAASRAGFKTVYLVPSMIHLQIRAETAGPLNKDKIRLMIFGLLNHWSQKTALRLAARVAAFSLNMQREILAVAPRSQLKAPILLCKPGIDPNRFYPDKESARTQLKAKFNIPAERVCLIIVSRLVSGKGIEIAIESMRYLGSGYHLIIIGDGLRRKQYESYARSLKVDPLVDFWGAQSCVEDFYRSADVFLMTSKIEPLGQTILEAGASGLPIVAFSLLAGVKTATEELNLGGHVYLADRYKAAALADTVRNMRDIHASKEQIHQHFRREFQWQRLVDELKQSC